MKRRKASLSAAAVTIAVAAFAATGIVTNASWVDTEWTHATLTTVDCENAAGAYASRAEGRLLSGTLLGTSLDDIVDIKGVTVTNNATQADASAGQPVEGVEDAWANPLSATILSSVSAELNGLLVFPTDLEVGVLGQFGQAHNNGQAAGASGVITDSGAIALSEAGGYPTLATVRLSDLLEENSESYPALASALDNVSDLALEIGAVAAQAELDGCAAAWENDLATALTRSYGASSLDLNFDSPTIGTLVSAVGGVEDETCDQPGSVVKVLECTVNGLASDDSVLNAIETGVAGLLGPLTHDLGLGDITVELSASVDTTPVQDLLDDSLSNDVLTINLTTGTVTIDMEALLGQTYDDGDVLNALAPNTNPLQNPAVVTVLSANVEELLNEWVDNVNAALDEIVDDVLVHATVEIGLTLRHGVLHEYTDVIGHILAEVDCSSGGAPKGCTLGQLLNSESSSSAVTAKFEILSGLDSLLLGLVDGLLNSVISPLVTNVTNGLGGVVGTAVEGSVSSLRELPDTVPPLVANVTTTVSTLYETLFLEDVVAITLNAQNDPISEGGASPEPSDWESLPEGQYDVAALRIGILEESSWPTILYFGRGSVGKICSVASAANDPSCSQYGPNSSPEG